MEGDIQVTHEPALEQRNVSKAHSPEGQWPVWQTVHVGRRSLFGGLNESMPGVKVRRRPAFARRWSTVAPLLEVIP